MALVFVGVLGESIHEFANFPRSARPQRLLTRASLALLIAGLAGELWAGHRISAITRLEVARSNADAKQADARAATADAEASKLQNQNLRLLSKVQLERERRLELAREVAPRYFRFQAVWPALMPYAGTKYEVWFVRDPEAERLARLIDETLRQAKWLMAGPLMTEENVNAYDEGVLVSYPSRSAAVGGRGPRLTQHSSTLKAAIALCRALARYNIAPELLSRDLPPGTVRVQVQFKPDPGSNEVMMENFRVELEILKRAGRDRDAKSND